MIMANTKKDRQFINGVTPKGECYYAFLRKPEMYEGNEVGYSIQIKMSEKDSKAFEDKLLTALEDAKDSFDLRAGKKWSKEPSYGKHVMKDGSVVFKFKAKTEMKSKTGEIKKRTILVVDAHNNPIKAEDLGNGSIVKIAYAAAPYWMNNNVNGMALYLRGVQVLKYVPFGGNTAEGLGFEVDETGYNSKEDTRLKEADEDDDDMLEFVEGDEDSEEF